MFDTLYSSNEMFVIVFYHVTVVYTAPPSLWPPPTRVTERVTERGAWIPSSFETIGRIPGRNPREMDMLNTAGGQCTI